MDLIKNNIVAWDQDVMNSYINGQYIDLSIDFNCLAEKINKMSKIPYFLHFLEVKNLGILMGPLITKQIFITKTIQKFMTITFIFPIIGKQTQPNSGYGH